MKKILLFFSVAVFVFCLATSVQAAVNNVVITGGELNYQTTTPITWTNTSGATSTRYNISMVAGSVSLPIATQVSCNVPATGGACAYSWKVGSLKSGRFVMGVNYNIKVCAANVSTLDCGNSANAFRIIPPALRTQQEVLNLFKTAMANRYGSLDSRGVKSYILGNGTTGSIKIPIATVNTAKVYAISVKEQLDWFKTEFTKNYGGAFSASNKEGIRQAMAARYTDICVADADWNTAIKALTKTYNTAVANAGKARAGVKAKAATATTPAVLATGEELCKFNYNRDLKDSNIVPARNSNYDNATLRFIALQRLQDTKDQCINGTYTQLYAAKVTALATFTAGKNTADGLYTACLGNRISSWDWLASSVVNPAEY